MSSPWWGPCYLRFLPDLRRNDGSFAPYATILIAGAEIRPHGQRGFGRRCQIRYLNAFKPEIVSLNHRCHLCSGLSLASRGSYGSSSCPICLFLTSVTIHPKCSWCGCHTFTSNTRTSTHSTNLLRISVS